ncbi:RNA polymerase sigma factor [Flavivirga algicola]|uniref:Sigma-70 family RNA polymerase sigma factor n=1 Tax=Flavivirga algicola TaxID=2729136 RepID=A0ABX1RZP5_9FLAO|nr:sigma-70 family RNA polymerase sigma factor [Flavivirga algicola]NMH89070.1 sigma-70 family RNA polymerase sigma factor [Flavivirga algicola]
MNKKNQEDSKTLTEHFFRTEYGKMVSVITKYLGTENIETAEDIVQETLLKAVDYWQHHGIPDHPKAWLYTTAKNLTINILKRRKQHWKFKTIQQNKIQIENLEISESLISDEQLKMMFVCCHPSISKKSQITLILKILCGFSISEIASAFFTSNETINKRLVRGRRQLRENYIDFYSPQHINDNLPVVLKIIYLIFNEGYSPTQKNELIRYDLCLESIRLCKILVSSSIIDNKFDCYALLALMYLNASRFNSRMNSANEIVEMDMQDRSRWDQELINSGIYYLNKATEKKQLSEYLILATISANHCIAPSFDKTNWKEILSLYNALIELNKTPVALLNRSIALSKVKGSNSAILELEKLASQTDIAKNHLFHATLSEFYKKENLIQKAIISLREAIKLSKNKRDTALLEKKLKGLVPIS